MKANLFLYIVLLIFLCSCSSQDKKDLPIPEIQEGIARVSGKISFPNNLEIPVEQKLFLRVPAPITGRSKERTTTLNPDGSFHFEIPVETNLVIGSIYSKAIGRGILLDLDANRENRLEISIDSTGEPRIISSTSMLTPSDMLSIGDMFGKMVEYRILSQVYDKNSNEAAATFLNNLKTRTGIVRSDSLLSDAAKQFLILDYSLLYLGMTVLDYEEVMRLEHLNAYPDQKDYRPAPPEESYYSILKEFDLNNPRNLYSYVYTDALQKLLADPTLNLPRIEETPVEQWLTEVKNRLTPYIGTDKGLIYDLLAINAYTRQFTRMEPLSARQIDNINQYFQQQPAGKLLLKKNQEVIATNAENQHFPSRICPTPDVPNEKLLESILADYKGKAVVMDFWATWCGPCMEGIEQSKQIKPLFKNDSIAFLYLATPSSPRETWNETIKGIHGDHYYLNREQWETVLNQLKEEGSIPLYLFVDNQGEIRQKKRGMMSAEEMKNSIKEILK